MSTKFDPNKIKFSDDNKIGELCAATKNKGELCATKQNKGELCATKDASDLITAYNIGELCASSKTKPMFKSNQFGTKSSTLSQSLVASKCSKRNCQKPCCINQASNIYMCSPDTTPFCVDSGATADMIGDIGLLGDTTAVHENIRVAKRQQCMKSLAIGKVHSKQYDLHNVRFVPDITRNLMSVAAVTDKDQAVLFSKTGVKLLKTDLEVPEDLIILKGERTPQGLFMVNLEIVKSARKGQESAFLSEKTI